MNLLVKSQIIEVKFHRLKIIKAITNFYINYLNKIYW